MGKRYSVTRILEWDAAHRVTRHESKCSTLHGHRYKAEITVSAPELDRVGRVVDFGFLKQILGGWVDEHWDHTTILSQEDGPLLHFLEEEVRSGGKKKPYVMSCEPTAENMAKWLFEVFVERLRQSPIEQVPLEVKVERVRIWETPNCYAEWPT